MRNFRLLPVFIFLAILIPAIAGCESKQDEKAAGTQTAESSASEKKPSEVKPVLPDVPKSWSKEDKQSVPKDWTIPIYSQSKLYVVSEIHDENLNKVTGTNIIIKSDDSFKKITDWYATSAPVDHKPDIRCGCKDVRIYRRSWQV